jgi:hypothetical protein
MRRRTTLAAAVFLVARMSHADDARTVTFDDPYDLPVAPRPPTLPELTHPDLEATFESTIGVLSPNGGGANVVTYVQRIGLEYPVAARRWFLGANYELAAGEPPGGGSVKVAGGNVEIYGRTVWATRTGLAFGGGIGLTAPIADFGQNGDAGRIATAAATLRPWDLRFFEEGYLTVHPFLDVRDVDGPFVVQFREGLDLLLDTAQFPTFGVAAVSALYIGYRFPLIGAGVEAFEYYLLKWDDIADERRASFVISPNVRLMTPYVQPAISAFTNIGTPLFGGVDHLWGLRLALTVLFDPQTRTVMKDRADPTK